MEAGLSGASAAEAQQRAGVGGGGGGDEHRHTDAPSLPVQPVGREPNDTLPALRSTGAQLPLGKRSSAPTLPARMHV